MEYTCTHHLSDYKTSRVYVHRSSCNRGVLQRERSKMLRGRPTVNVTHVVRSALSRATNAVVSAVKRPRAVTRRPAQYFSDVRAETSLLPLSSRRSEPLTDVSARTARIKLLPAPAAVPCCRATSLSVSPLPTRVSTEGRYTVQVGCHAPPPGTSLRAHPPYILNSEPVYCGIFVFASPAAPLAAAAAAR